MTLVSLIGYVIGKLRLSYRLALDLCSRHSPEAACSFAHTQLGSDEHHRISIFLNNTSARPGLHSRWDGSYVSTRSQARR